MVFTKFELIKFGSKLLLLCFLFTTQLNANKPSWQSKAYIKKAFFEIAYKHEYGIKKNKLGLVRWEKPIEYRIDYVNLPSPVELVENMVQDHFQDLSDITGLSVSKNNKKPNFRIILTKRDYYKDAIERFTSVKEGVKKEIENLHTETSCIFETRQLNFKIEEVLVIIPVDHVMRYGNLPACVVEELTQATGISNDSDWVNPSVANDKSPYDLLTGLDYLFLKILYDKRLSVGMSIAQSGPIIDKILLEFEKNNLIEGSILEVRKLRLSQQLE